VSSIAEHGSFDALHQGRGRGPVFVDIQLNHTGPSAALATSSTGVIERVLNTKMEPAAAALAAAASPSGRAIPSKATGATRIGMRRG